MHKGLARWLQQTLGTTATLPNTLPQRTPLLTLAKSFGIHATPGEDFVSRRRCELGAYLNDVSKLINVWQYDGFVDFVFGDEHAKEVTDPARHLPPTTTRVIKPDPSLKALLAPPPASRASTPCRGQSQKASSASSATARAWWPFSPHKLHDITTSCSRVLAATVRTFGGLSSKASRRGETKNSDLDSCSSKTIELREVKEFELKEMKVDQAA